MPLADRRLEVALQEAILEAATTANERERRIAGFDAQPPRRHKRIKLRIDRTFVKTSDGRTLNAVVADISQSGVALRGNFPGLGLGNVVRIGSRDARVMRLLKDGLAFELVTEIPAEIFNEDFVL